MKKSEQAPVKTGLNHYLSIWLACFYYTKQLNVYHSFCITHLVIFVKKKIKIRTHFCSSTRKATKISINLKIVVCVFHSPIFLITKKVSRSKLITQCLCQISDKENHILILCHKSKWKNCLCLCTHKRHYRDTWWTTLLCFSCLYLKIYIANFTHSHL